MTGNMGCGLLAMPVLGFVKQRAGVYLGFLFGTEARLALQHWQSQWHTTLFGHAGNLVP